MAKVQWCSTYELPEYVDPLNVEDCKRFVYSHRNVFNRSTRRYVVSTFPIAIKEVNVDQGGNRHYWLWIIRPGYYSVAGFETKPSQEDIMKVINGTYREE